MRFDYWTPEERATLIEMRIAGKSLKEIAAALPGRSFKGVHNYIKRHGLPCKTRKAHVRKPRPPASILASEALRDAIGAAIMRFAHSQGMSIVEATATLLGSEPSLAPRRIRPVYTDYTGHLPQEIRPIGEIVRPIVARMAVA